MKTIVTIGIYLSLTLLFSQMICGLWIGSKGADPSSAKFHAVLGISAVVVSAITLVLAAVKLRHTA